MIVVKLIGGLGNQMFQYAAGRYLAHLHQTELLVDVSHLNKEANGAYTQRRFELDVWNVNVKVATEKDIQRFNIHRSNKISRVLQRTLPILFSNVYAAESGAAYQKQFLNFPKNTYLDGFWQSERYFKPIREKLLQEFTSKVSLNSANTAWFDKIKNTESVSLHIRRGDYISHKTANAHHGVCGVEYYEKAVRIIQEKHKSIELFIFSDDLDWCRETLKFNSKMYFVDSNQRENLHLDMVLMSYCKHNVIANSSFSWWAAWLNQYSDKIVVAPGKWFNDTSINTSDLIPQEWIKL